MKRICMKRLRACSLLLLAVLLLTVPVFADSGPKPMIYVRVENGPEEPYYMDLLEEDPYNAYFFDPGRRVWGYSEEYEAGLDQDLMDGLLAAVPEGWHSCSLQGTRGGLMYADLDGSRSQEEGLHRFVSHGVPETFRVLAVTKSGQIFCSEPLTRRAYQVSVTLDWSAGTVSLAPVWQRYVLQFLATFVPTILIEGVFLWLLGLWSRRNVLVFLLVNLLTQGGPVPVVQHRGHPLRHWLLVLLDADSGGNCRSGGGNYPVSPLSAGALRRAGHYLRGGGQSGLGHSGLFPGGTGVGIHGGSFLTEQKGDFMERSGFFRTNIRCPASKIRKLPGRPKKWFAALPGDRQTPQAERERNILTGAMKDAADICGRW